MREAGPVVAFGSWSAEGIPLTIEYSLDVMEQIRAATEQALRHLSGAFEIGGVLFGSRVSKSIRILAWRPIACEYTRAPAFVLSPGDGRMLSKLLQSAADDPELTGLYPLGWFVSHLNGGVTMSAPDRKVYRHFFPSDCQTTLVLHPSSDGSVRAGFFLRDASGEPATSSALEFTIERTTEAPVAISCPEPAESRAGPPSFNAPYAVPESGLSRGVSRSKRLQDYRAWVWTVLALLALIVAALMVPRTRAPKIPATFSLRAAEVGGDLRLEWDRNADVIREGARGSLDIKDGGIRVPISLNADRLKDGYFDYKRLSGDLELRMTVYPTKGEPVTELAKFLGPPVTPPVTSDQVADVTSERDRLKAELDQLRDSLRKQAARNRQLEDTVRILEQRVQVQKLLEPKQ